LDLLGIKLEHGKINYYNFQNKEKNWIKVLIREEKHKNKSQVEEFFNKYIKESNRIFSNSFSIVQMTSFSGDVWNCFLPNIFIYQLIKNI